MRNVKKMYRQIGGFLLSLMILVSCYRLWPDFSDTRDFETTLIPHIIHQSYITTDLPIKFEKWAMSFIHHHPSWEYRFWTDIENDAFVKESYPWFYPTYTNLTHKINRVDVVRYMYLHAFGGVYVDLDTESIRPMDFILHNQHLVLGTMGDLKFAHDVPNAWMASKPRHDFWIHLLTDIMFHERKQHRFSVEELTGPVLLYRVLFRYLALPRDEQQPITLLNPDVVYPYSWRHDTQYTDVCSAMHTTFDSQKCKNRLVTSTTVAISYWSHSWDVVPNRLLDSKKGT